MKNLTFIFILLCGNLLFSQSNQVGINTTTPHQSAIMQLETFVGKTATATAVMSGGVITAINITDGGSGYETAPVVSIVGGGAVINNGAKASAVASISGGSVTSITVTGGGNNYTSVPQVVIANTNKGFLMPRLDLITLTNTVTPVSSPADGLLAVNKSSSHDKTIFYFDNLKSAWTKAVLSRNTPKIAYIEITGSTNMLLTPNPNAGGRNYALQSLPILSPVSNIQGVKIISDPRDPFPVGVSPLGVPYYTIVLPQGDYIVEIKLNITATPAATCSLCTGSSITAPLSNGSNVSDYYLMGYYVDLYPDDYNNATGVITPPVVTAGTNRLRKENPVVSKIGVDHFSSWIFNVTVPANANRNLMKSVRVYLGRMQGSTYYNQVTLKGEGSYIKITKD